MSSHIRICRFTSFFLNGREAFHGRTAPYFYLARPLLGLGVISNFSLLHTMQHGSTLVHTELAYTCFPIARELLNQSRHVHL